MPNTYSRAFKIAAVQASPVFLDREATVAKACDLINEVGNNGACLAVFPETFIPAYPDWVWAVPAGEGGVLAGLYADLLANSVEIPSEATRRLGEAAKQAGIHVVMGVTERNVEASGSSLYNTLIYFDSDGKILGKHRKLMPTGGERLVWAQGDGSTLEVYDTPFGKLGGLICWENYMPLARYSMYAWGAEVYVAPTWDRSDSWIASLRHIGKEGRVYVVGCCMALRKSDIPDSFEFKERFYQGVEDWINVGNSTIVNPEGDIIAGPLCQSEGILYAEIDPKLLRGSRWMFDVAGHYGRPDVFQLTVNREPHAMISSGEAPSIMGDEALTIQETQAQQEA